MEKTHETELPRAGSHAPEIKTAWFRFYAELNDLLPGPRRQVRFAHRYRYQPSIKDMIESLGVPHTEIELIVVGGRSVGFEYSVADGDEINVYPVFESMDVTPLVRLRPRPLRRTRFVADVHLAPLAGYLRLLGFDTLYRNDYEDEELARISSIQRRCLLTRDRGLLKRKEVTHGYCVHHQPSSQLTEVLERFDLYSQVQPFARCSACNGEIEPVEKAEVLPELPPYVAKTLHEFNRCNACRRVYWKGTHYTRIRAFIDDVLRRGPHKDASGT